jgi:hypothetical protein
MSDPMDQWLDDLDPDTVEVRDPVALRRIGAAKLRMGVAEAELRQAVKDARREGETWAAIGRTLGTTRQAAQARFGGD